MADVNVQINVPILTGSDFFKVRYRLLPAGAFTSFQNETNAPFTLTGLTPGDYEMEIILVRDEIECPPAYKYFTVKTPFTCVTFTAQIVQTGSLYNVELSYGTIAVNPPCGWLIQVIGNTNNKSIPYATLPTSPLLIPMNYEAVLFKVLANMCNGKYQTCYEADLTPPPPSCTPISGISVNLQYLIAIGPLYNRFRLTFTFTQSNPPTQFMHCLVSQTTKNLLGGIPGQVSYGAFNPVILPLNATSFSVDIDANTNVFVGWYDFDWALVDRCGKKHTGTVSVQL